MMASSNMSCVWEHIPDDITLHVFTFLMEKDLHTNQIQKNITRVHKKQVWTQYFTFHSKLLDLLVNFSILSLVPELLVTKTNEHINTYQQT
jgi:hypothetical protein